MNVASIPAMLRRRLALATVLVVGLGLAALTLEEAGTLSPEAESAARSWLERDPSFAGQPVLIVDFTRPSFVRRAHLYDPRSRAVLESFFVAHGVGSGWATVDVVSNQPGSLCSSAGAYRTGDLYEGRHGRSLRLHGLEPGINDRAFARSVVLHGADYASGWSVLSNFGRLGRSEGCLAFSLDVVQGVIDQLGTGALVYVHAS